MLLACGFHFIIWAMQLEYVDGDMEDVAWAELKRLMETFHKRETQRTTPSAKQLRGGGRMSSKGRVGVAHAVVQGGSKKGAASKGAANCQDVMGMILAQRARRRLPS